MGVFSVWLLASPSLHIASVGSNHHGKKMEDPTMVGNRVKNHSMVVKDPPIPSR